MAGEIIASNVLLLDRSQLLRTYFNASHSLYLFQNDFRPTPANVFADFIEASYPGYARVNMTGKWKEVRKVIDGQYQFTSNDITFTPTGASTEQVFGWYLVTAGKVQFSCRLPFPNTMTLGSPLTVRIDCITWAAAIL